MSVVRSSEAIGGVGKGDSLVSFVTTTSNFFSPGVFLKTAFKQVVTLLATLATRVPKLYVLSA